MFQVRQEPAHHVLGFICRKHGGGGLHICCPLWQWRKQMGWIQERLFKSHTWAGSIPGKRDPTSQLGRLEGPGSKTGWQEVPGGGTDREHLGAEAAWRGFQRQVHGLCGIVQSRPLHRGRACRRERKVQSDECWKICWLLEEYELLETISSFFFLFFSFFFFFLLNWVKRFVGVVFK